MSEQIVSNNSAHNYYEFILLQDPKPLHNSSDLKIYNNDLNKNDFYSFLEQMHNISWVGKPFEKNFHQKLYQDLCFQIFDDGEIKIWKKQVNNFTFYNNSSINQWIVFQSTRTRQSPLQFPSTMEIPQENLIRSLIFRITSRIYVNFENYFNIKTKKKGYQIIVNYNHDNNVDLQQVNKKLNDVLNLWF